MATGCLMRGRSRYFGDLSQPGSAANLAAYYAGTDPNSIFFAIHLGYQYFNSCQVTSQIEVSWGARLRGGPGQRHQYGQRGLGSLQRNGPFCARSNGRGVFGEVRTQGRAPDSRAVWQGTTVVLDRVAPEIHITSPQGTSCTKPVIQVKGFCPRRCGCLATRSATPPVWRPA